TSRKHPTLIGRDAPSSSSSCAIVHDLPLSRPPLAILKRFGFRNGPNLYGIGYSTTGSGLTAFIQHAQRGFYLLLNRSQLFERHVRRLRTHCFEQREQLLH